MKTSLLAEIADTGDERVMAYKIIIDCPLNPNVSVVSDHRFDKSRDVLSSIRSIVQSDELDSRPVDRTVRFPLVSIVRIIVDYAFERYELRTAGGWNARIK